MGTTSRDGLRYPGLNDPPNVPQDMRFLAEDVEGQLHKAFECTSTTRPTLDADDAGFLVFETDTGEISRWSGTTWATVGAGGGGGGSAFVAVPGQWRASSAQSIPDSTDTVLGFGTSEITSGVVTRATSGTGHKFTIGSLGTYVVAATVRWADGADGRRFIELRNAAQTVRYPGASVGHRVEDEPCTLAFTSAPLVLAAATELVVIGAQTTGGSLSLEHTGSTITDGFVRLNITKIG
jgi:hypothetical protein